MRGSRRLSRACPYPPAMQCQYPRRDAAHHADPLVADQPMMSCSSTQPKMISTGTSRSQRCSRGDGSARRAWTNKAIIMPNARIAATTKSMPICHLSCNASARHRRACFLRRADMAERAPQEDVVGDLHRRTDDERQVHRLASHQEAGESRGRPRSPCRAPRRPRRGCRGTSPWSRRPYWSPSRAQTRTCRAAVDRARSSLAQARRILDGQSKGATASPSRS